MKDIRDAIRDAPRSRGDILTPEFGRKLLNVYYRLMTLAESVGQPTIFSDHLVDLTFQPLNDGYHTWEFLFKSYQAQLLEDGRRRRAA